MLPRVISLIVLLTIVTLLGLLFYQVMIGFLMPIFLAVLTAVIFQSLFDWLLPRLKNSRQLAALATTGIVFLLIAIPTVVIGFRAWSEAIHLYDNREMLYGKYLKSSDHAVPTNPSSPVIAGAGNAIVTPQASEKPVVPAGTVEKHQDGLLIFNEIVDWINTRFGLQISVDDFKGTVADRANAWLAPLAQKPLVCCSS